ncbi:hypothetical protein [Streptomyces panacea]
MLEYFPERVFVFVFAFAFAFDEFGPLGIRPTGGSCRARQGRPGRVP